MSRVEEIFYEAFDGLERLAPGSEATTVRALQRAQKVLEPRRILDIGCGAGAQALVLARHCTADIVAVDTHAPYLEALTAKAGTLGIGARVRTVEASMLDLKEKLANEVFDLLWTEGSIYVIGFDRGLAEWRGLLRVGGILACTELSWLTSAPSEAARGFWGEGYPAMRGIAENIAAAVKAGFACLDHFVLPASDWLESYYAPLEARIRAMRDKYVGDPEANGVLNMLQAEIDLYRSAGRDYGYVFYLLQRAA